MCIQGVYKQIITKDLIEKKSNISSIESSLSVVPEATGGLGQVALTQIHHHIHNSDIQ